MPVTCQCPNPPVTPALPRRHWRPVLRQSFNDNEHFGRLAIDGWRGHFLRRPVLERFYSRLAPTGITADDWRQAWPCMLAGLGGAWHRFKHDHSGTVAGGSIQLGGQQLDIVAKQPRRTRPEQWLIDLARPARARRSWIKTWKLLLRGLPTEIPLLLMEHRRLGTAVDNIVVYERVPGPTVERMPLNPLAPEVRRQLLQRIGRTLRMTDSLGVAHLDAKTSNWIAVEGTDGLYPVMLDCDGVRFYRARTAGLRRLLKALARHPDFVADDATAVCNGYAPEGWDAKVHGLHERYGTP